MHQSTSHNRGFTLIELLTVVAIIAILVGLLFPAITTALKKADKAQAKSDVNSLEQAIRYYYLEYGKYPVPDGDQGAADKSYGETGPGQNGIIDTLRATNTTLNVRKIIFLEIPNRKGALDPSGYFKDPWGKQYLIRLDLNYSGGVDYPAGGTPNRPPVVVVSYGPNGIEENPAVKGCDDIFSFQ